MFCKWEVLVIKKYICILLCILSFGILLSQHSDVQAAYSENLEIFYLDVGEGDAAVVLCGDSVMLIDGGTASSSDKIYSFLQKHNISHVDYLVASHPDEDHIGGLAAVPYAVDSIGTVFCTDDIHSTRIFNSFTKSLSSRQVSVRIPDAGETFHLGNAEVTILAPEKNVKLSNNTSLIIRIDYKTVSFLFTGDAESEDENALLKCGTIVRSNVIKIGHHGSRSSTSESFLNAVSPDYAVISVGDNTYGHPTEEVLNRLKTGNIKTYRTDLQGDIHCISDGESIMFSVDKNADADVFVAHGSSDTFTLVSDADITDATVTVRSTAGIDYIGNLNSHKFHYPDCASVSKMKEENKLYFHGTRDELIAQGYDPCGNCHP